MKKIFGIKWRFGSAKEALKVFRLIMNKEDFPDSSSMNINQNLELSKTLNVQAYLVGIQRTNEIEAERARAILDSRHHSWKAGGPH